MGKQTVAPDALHELSIDRLELTLKTTQLLKAQGIERVDQLVKSATSGMEKIGLEQARAIEVREVLASRGL